MGKRCFINELIFDIDDPRAQLEVESPTTFAAGDSDTDFFFVRDARVLRLVINRQAPELMCHAYANLDGRWLINPRFINPLPMRDEPYDCDPFDLSDQVDTVFCTDMRYEPGSCSAPLR